MKVGDFCKTGAGGTPLKSNRRFYEGGTIPWLLSGEVGNRDITETKKFITQEGLDGSSAKMFPVNTVLIAMYGATAGEVGILRCEASTNQAVCGIYPNDSVLPEYLYYFFLNHKDLLVAQAVGNAQPNISQLKIKNTEFPLIPIQEQKRIVTLLDTVFADLEQTRTKTEQNLKNARELFDSYLQQVFSQKGEGWEEKKWGDMCKFIRGPFGGSLKKSMFKPEGYAVYEQKHAIHDHIEQLRYYVDEEKFEEMKRFELKPGELIMSCSGVTLGKASVIPEGAPKGIINQALLKLTANDNLDIHFLKYWIRSKIFQDIIFEHAGGAAIPNVPAAKILKEIKLQIPTIEKQKVIVSEIDSMVSKRDSLLRIYAEKSAALDELKKSILQKAFSGELTTTAK